MRVLAITVSLVAGLATAALADPAGLLAPDDPANGSGWRPPPPVTGGLEAFAPVEAKDWLQLNQGAGSGAAGGKSGGMMDMPGMEHSR